MVTIKDLERECNNYNLTEYLKKCSNEDLENCMRLVLCDDIIGIREKICECLLMEMQHRNSINNMNAENSDVIKKSR